MGEHSLTGVEVRDLGLPLRLPCRTPVGFTWFELSLSCLLFGFDDGFGCSSKKKKESSCHFFIHSSLNIQLT
jgi:hypothetical protein